MDENFVNLQKYVLSCLLEAKKIDQILFNDALKQVEYEAREKHAKSA